MIRKKLNLAAGDDWDGTENVGNENYVFLLRSVNNISIYFTFTFVISHLQLDIYYLRAATTIEVFNYFLYIGNQIRRSIAYLGSACIYNVFLIQ